MARRSKGAWKRDDGSPAGTPLKEDEADIVDEIGAEPSEEDGEQLVVSEETLREQGAVDSESIRENRHAKEVIGKKRAGHKNVMFNIGSVLVKYEELSKYCPINTIDIVLKRLTGSPIEWVITSRPASGAALYEAVMLRHGRHEEAEYEVKFRDTTRKETRGTGRITLPNTLDTAPPGGQAMNPYNPYAPPPPPYGQPQYPPQYAAHPVPQPPPQAAPPPVPAASAPPPFSPYGMMPPQGQPMTVQEMMAFQRQQFELMQAAMAAGVQSVPLPTPAAPTSSGMPYVPPGMVYFPNIGVVTLEQAAQLMGVAQPARQPAPEPPQAPPTRMPPVQPPPGTVFVDGFGFVSYQALAEAQAAGQGIAPPRRPSPYREEPRYEGPPAYRGGPYPNTRSAYGGPPGYGPQGPGPGGPPYGYPNAAPQPPPSPPRTAEQQFSDAISMVQAATNMATKLRNIAGVDGGAQQQYEPPEPEPVAESPVSVMDIGDYKLVLDKKDGNARVFETVWANSGNILKWFSEQREAFQRAQPAAAPPPPRHLPPGYVEMHPGFKAPPGYVAVPVDPAQVPAYTPLPTPPTDIPPPIVMVEEPGETQQQQWGMPAAMPGSEY